VVICAKTAEPIEMTFGLWARMDHRNHVLDGGAEALRDVAMATNFGTTNFGTTNFGTTIDINWLCVNDSN